MSFIDPALQSLNQLSQTATQSALNLVGGFPSAPINAGDITIGNPSGAQDPATAGGFPINGTGQAAQNSQNPQYSQPQNSMQRWQTRKPIRDFSPERRYFYATGSIDASAPRVEGHSGLSYADRGAKGFTPENEWAKMFNSHMATPPSMMRLNNSWDRKTMNASAGQNPDELNQYFNNLNLNAPQT